VSSNKDLLLNPDTASSLDSLASRLPGLVADSFPVARDQLAGDIDDQIDAQIVIRNLMGIIGRAILLSDRQLFDGGIQAAVAIWDLGDRAAMYSTRTPSFEASLWEGMGVELYTLGGLAVRYEKWAELRALTVQQPETTGKETWLRQGQVASGRAAEVEMSFLSLPAARLRTQYGPMSPEESLEAVARFDLLSGLIIMETPPARFYPNAAEFSEELVEPIVIGQLRESSTALRQHVFPRDDSGLREALRLYDQMARSQAAIMRYWTRDWAWRAFADGRTWAFITEGSILESLPRMP